MTWLGLDIGGANIKAATTDGQSYAAAFPFWEQHGRLEAALIDIIEQLQPSRIAATMTAELADCFESRKAGVAYIVDCLTRVCRGRNLCEPIFAATDVQFRSAAEAKDLWLKTAASNWAMTAAFAARFLPGKTGAMIDVGSTTTDMIPIVNGRIATSGLTDSQRMIAGELIYVGVDRTPVCSVVNALTHNDISYPIAAEFFATVGDAFLLSGLVEESPKDCSTADGRPRTVRHAAQRICSMVCEDVETIGIEAAQSFAAVIVKQVLSRLFSGLSELQKDHQLNHIVVTGSGSPIVLPKLRNSFPEIEFKQLSNEVGKSIDTVAPAYATAVLAKERAFA